MVNVSFILGMETEHERFLGNYALQVLVDAAYYINTQAPKILLLKIRRTLVMTYMRIFFGQ